MATVHSRISEAPAAHLELQHQVQSMLPQGVDGVDNQGNNNVNAIWLMLGYTGLEDSKEYKRWAQDTKSVTSKWYGIKLWLIANAQVLCVLKTGWFPEKFICRVKCWSKETAMICTTTFKCWKCEILLHFQKHILILDLSRAGTRES